MSTPPEYLCNAYREMSDLGLQAQLDDMANELLDRYEELTLLYSLGASFADLLDAEQICEIALEKAGTAIGASKAIVALATEGGELRAVSVRGTDRLSKGGVTEYVARSGRELLLHRGEPAPAGATRDDTDGGPILSMPLLPPDTSEPLGALTLAGAADGEAFTSGDAKLARAIAGQLAAAVYRGRLVNSLRASEAVRRDVEIAAGIQRTLLPEAPPSLPGVEIAAVCVAAGNVGGDYYDFVVDDEGRLAVVIADVAGHSIGSALMMAMARTILRLELAEGKSPAEVLAATNEALFDDLVGSALFITAFCARLDPRTGQLDYANAGHNPPLVRRTTGEPEELDADGAAIGILRTVEFEGRATTLAGGDLLLLYTDGVTEAAGPTGEQFGEERLREALDDSPAAELIDRVFRRVREHASGAPQGDDITLVVVRTTPST